MNLQSKSALRNGIAFGMFLGIAALAQPALAQDATPADNQPAAGSSNTSNSSSETIVVTGSRIRRDEFTSSSPVQVITAETATLEGLVDAAEILQGSSIANGSAQLNNQFGGYVVEGGTGIESVSLRGLGAQRSLVLLNARRPGPAGVRGQVGAFDLNVIPTSAVQRYEILKDGASSVYGSDAVAGVVNIITRDRIDKPELTWEYHQPLDKGGETYSLDGAFGLNFDRGNIVVSGQYQIREALKVGDRDYLSCPQDLVYDRTSGAQIDRADHSILAGTSLAGCNNIYFNTVIDAFTGLRYIPSPNGVSVGPIPGYRPRANQTYAQGDPNTAYYEDVLNSPLYASTDAINRQERGTIFITSNFNFDALGGVTWNNELLYTHRHTTSDGWRQFFPLIADPALGAYANSPDYSPAFLLSQPVTIWPSNDEANIDYVSFSSQLDGHLTSNWTWTLIGTYSRSDGVYEGNSIIASQSGDANYDDNAPVYDPFSPDFLSGNYGQAVYDHLTHNSRGETVYDQKVFTGYVTGDLFKLPAGSVSGVLGVEYRNYSIDDQPDQLAQNGDLWGESSALVTAGEDTVKEVFTELEVPILAGKPFFEALTLNASARAFDYDSYGSDSVWRVGLNWQINPLLRIRGTKGTSYRAPALYELYLGNQTAFLDQLAIDPCVDWANSTNQNVRQNCAAAGIPDDYTGAGASATIVSGGGAGVLKAETSQSYTIGVIFTPTALDFNVAVDYFEIVLNDEVAQLGADVILGGCYGANNYPNGFCDLFDRNAGNDPVQPYGITQVRDSYINVNQQITSGIDLTVRYDHDFDLGHLTFEGQVTWTKEDVAFLFDPSIESGFDTNDFNGTIGDPDFVGSTRLSFERGDWTYSWFADLVSRTSNVDFVTSNSDYTYFGRDATRKLYTEAIAYHDFTVRWRGATLTIIGGLENAFDEAPPTISTGVAQRRGNAALSGSQYDLRGRTAFVRFNKSF
jgi:iron complex outermembrane recepter protein